MNVETEKLFHVSYNYCLVARVKILAEWEKL